MKQEHPDEINYMPIMAREQSKGTLLLHLHEPPIHDIMDCSTSPLKKQQTETPFLGEDMCGWYHITPSTGKMHKQRKPWWVT